MECLAKDPAARPLSAAVVSERLAAAVPADAWTLSAAHAWWERHRPLTRTRPPTEPRRTMTALLQPPTFHGDHLLSGEVST